MKSYKREIYRILDANANRVREGLRVLEDIARFIYNDESLTRLLKEERHRVTSLLTEIPGRESLLEYRNSISDVGAKSSLVSEREKDEVIEIVISNFRRSQEAIRVLEEFTKLFKGTLSMRFKAMRFRLYALEKQLRR